ncbi:MAG: tetratricopeptide repeat protein [Chthoniobacterales bacterium]|nr:tetratricopeptide repeat protein [Chthoniobacterales bacterium]
MLTSKAPPSGSGKWNWTLVVSAIMAGVLTALGLRQMAPTDTVPLPQGPAPSANVPNQQRSEETEIAIRFYLDRISRDPEETRSQNALAELYLRRVRETGNEDHLPLALNAARASLAAVEASQNPGGLSALAKAEFANHDFAAARDHALQLAELQPQKSEPYAILGDACLELGEYDRAFEAFRKMEQFGKEDAGTETRLARLAGLRGDPKRARQHLSTALSLLRSLQTSPRETIAWCHWQLGEIAFGLGDYKTAEGHYQDALSTASDDFRALGSLGRLYAARGDLPSAIKHLEQAVRVAPAVDSMAALGDLYRLSGQGEEAAARYEFVAQLSEHSRKVHGTPHNRALANFYANHDLKLDEAYALAAGEYAAGRRDIYGADALAWTALKANRLTEAQGALKEALKLGTLDAKLFYHAGMIARAAGNRAGAIDYLQRALVLNPGFDPLQREVAQDALKELTK